MMLGVVCISIDEVSLQQGVAFARWAVQTQWKATAKLQTSTEDSDTFRHCTYINVFSAKRLSFHA